VRLAIDQKLVFAVLVAASIGLAISYRPVAFALSIAVPACALHQKRRLDAAAVAFAYYAGAIWQVIRSAATFFGPNAGLVDGLVIWLFGAALLSLPYALVWNAHHRFIGIRSISAVLISVPPPLGIIGAASPLTAAGLLFPGTGWFGLAATLAAIAAFCVRPVFSASAVAVIALFCNVANPSIQKPPADWEAISTHFGGLGLSGNSAEAELRAAELIQRRALTSHARMIVFPETAVPRWTEATDLFWQQNLDAIASSGKTVLIGTTLDIEGRPGYENGVIMRGAQTGTFLQHIPVPFGMWNPIRSSSVPLHIFGPSIITIGGRRAAILVCYEQFLTWPVLKAALERPNLLVGIANDYWCVNTRVPAMQRRVIRMWANLFQVPVLTATNL
jgi:apolipoprotein N-acyltransferase